MNTVDDVSGQIDDSPSVRMLLERLEEKLPTPDGVAVAIMEAWERESGTAAEMARLVQTDPALTGRVLKLANSASVGLRPVASVPDAVVRVGMKTVGQLAIAFSLMDGGAGVDCPGFDHQAYWSRSLLMAVMARSLGSETRLAPPEDLFAAGLLGRIGVLGLASAYPEQYGAILSSAPATWSRQEKNVFGLDHNELTEAMMLDFYVPRILAEPMRYAEVPSHCGFDMNSRPYKLVILFHTAWRLSVFAESGELPDDEVVDAFAAKIGLEKGRIDGLLEDAVDGWKEWSQLLGFRSTPQKAAVGEDEAGAGGPSAVSPACNQLARLGVVVKRQGAEIDAVLAHLEALGAMPFSSEKPSELLRHAIEKHAKVFICHSDDLRLVQALRETSGADGIQVFVVCDTFSVDLECRAFAAGADQVICCENMSGKVLEMRLQPALRMLELHERWRNDRQELSRIAKELAISHRQQQVLALTDQLTGLPNRRAAMESLNKAWIASDRRAVPCAIQIMDLDHFKAVNDRYGHAAGDQVLRSVSEVLESTVRGDEAIARIGGEEFLLISNQMDAREAIVAAERLRRRIGSALIDVGGERLTVSASVGVALREKGINSPEDLMRAADKALYAAKESGRNRLCLFTGGQVRFLKTATGP